MQINTLDSFLDRYVDGYLLTDIATLIKKVPATSHQGDGAYLITAATCSGMDLVGSLTTKIGVVPGCEACNKKEQIRFKFPIDHYCAHYMSKIDERYKQFGPVARELVRNGIMHSFATKGRIGITRKGDKSNHLTRMSDRGFLVINADCFYEDFKKSYLEYARPEISEGGDKRRTALKNYEKMREIKEDEIDRTMKDMAGKLDSWPQIDASVAYSPEQVDQVEESGEIQYIS